MSLESSYYWFDALGPILGADNLIVSMKNKEKNIEYDISHDHLTIGAEFDVKAGEEHLDKEMRCHVQWA